MEESRVVLERLARIEALDAAGASAAELLTELRELLSEAESWSLREGGDAERRAVAELRKAFDAHQTQAGQRNVSVAREP